MSSFKVVSIKKSLATIYTSEGVDMISLVPIDFNISYLLGSLPTCTASLVGGQSFDGTVGDWNDVDVAFSQCSNGRCKLEITLTVQIIDDKGKKSGEEDIIIFNGVITSASINANTSAYGKSSRSLVVAAYHNFAELYQYGANGMIYEQPSAIKYNNSIRVLLNNIEADTKHKANSTTTSNANVVSEVLNTYAKVDDASSKLNTNAPIVTVLDDIITRMVDAKVLDKDLDITQYINGTVYPNLSSKFVRSFTHTYLQNIWNNVSKGSVGSAILTMATANGYILTIAPRDPFKVTLLPLDGFTIYSDDKNGPPKITSDMYHAINYSMPRGVHPTAEGVIVSLSGSEYNGESSGKGVIIGKYPQEGADKIRWKYVGAPSWLIDTSAYASSAKSGAKNVDPSVYRDLCNNYARYVYNSLIHSNNRIILSMDARALEAYKALGAVMVVDTAHCGDIQGLFSAYTLSYKSQMAGSSLNVSVSLSHVKPYDEDEAKKSSNVGKRVFEIGKADIITKFPDISNVDSQ